MKEKIAKKGMAKRLLGAFLAFAMLVTLLPAGTMAVEAGSSDTADVTWTLDDIGNKSFGLYGNNTHTLNGIELSGAGCSMSPYQQRNLFYFSIGYKSGGCYMTLRDTQNRKIKKIIISLATADDVYTSNLEAPGWSYSTDNKEFIWEGEAADSVTLERKNNGVGGVLYATKVEFYLESTKVTPTAEDFSYDSSTGIVSAAEGKDLGTVTTYYKVDSTWTTTKPTVAGTYEVGAATEGSDTYNAIGSAEEPFVASWSYIVKASDGDGDASDTDKKDNAGKTAIATDKQAGNFAAGGLVSTADELKNAVLTDADKAAIAAGKDLSVWVEMKDQTSTVSDTDKTAVTAKLPTNYVIGSYLDINLWKQVEGSTASKVTETVSGKVKIAFTIPTSLQKSGRTYKLIRLHDGEATVLDTTVDANYALTFETDRFSTYALVYADTASEEETTTTTTTTTDTTATATSTSPKTGDTSNVTLYLVMLMLGAAGFAGLSVRRKRQ